MTEGFISTKEISRLNQNYIDFDLDFNTHPATGDIMLKVGPEAVKRSLRNLILLHTGEIGFSPSKGSGVHYLLFENFTPGTIKMLSNKIEEVIIAYEPRVELLELIIDEIDHELKVDVIFNIVNTNDPIQMNLFLERVR